ncbi:MAG: hypothetical protein JWR69_4427, partial [Pedosphaera sp.]|nr:hypothetical protein [Pedosphaera sp.]
MFTQSTTVQAQSFYSMAHTNWPPLPFARPGLDVYDLGSNHFLVDDRFVEETMQILSLMEGPPSPGDGTGTNDGVGIEFSPIIHGSNELWLEITNLTNSTVSGLVHGTVEGNSYQFLSSTNLALPLAQWTLGPIFTGASGTNQTPFPTNISAAPPKQFFLVHATNQVVSISVAQDPFIGGPFDSAEPFNEAGDLDGEQSLFGQSAFYFSRTGSDLSSGLTVPFTISGTASNGFDYETITSFITFDGGNDQVSLPINALFTGTNGRFFSVDVNLTIIQTNSYLIDTNNGPSATVIIERNNNGKEWLEIVHTNGSLGLGIGMDYHPISNLLILSIDGGTPLEFNSVNTNGTLAPWSGISGLSEEVKVACVPTTNNPNFQRGDLYFGNGGDGGVGKLSASHFVSNLNWVTLTNFDGSGEPANLRGSLRFDTTGDWGFDLIAVTGNAGGGGGGVWRIHSQTNFTQLTNLNCHLEGVTTIPNNTNKYGPWAGKILAGAEDGAPGGIPPCVFSIDTNGASAHFDFLTIHPEDIHIIKTNQDFYVNGLAGFASAAIFKLPRNSPLTNFV